MYTNNQEAYCCSKKYFDNFDCPDEAILVSPKNRHACIHRGEFINNYHDF